MLHSKTPQEIETLAEGGAILAEILAGVAAAVKPGVTSRELDALARALIAQRGARPSFLGYVPKGHQGSLTQRGFPAALCVSVNEAVVHGLPTEIPLCPGDVVGLDLGIVYQGLYLDSACTVPVGEVSREAQRLLAVTKRALELGIEAASVGRTTGDIGAAIQRYVEGNGFGIVRALVGHGVGYDVHEEPAVPNYGVPGKGEKLVEGLVIAIEPMVVHGNADVITADDGWTVKTVGGGLAAHEEHTVAITAQGPRVLTMLHS